MTRPLPLPPPRSQLARFKSDAPKGAAGEKKKVQPLSFGIVTRVKDGVAFARDLGFASFGELVIFVPSPARLKSLQAAGRCVQRCGVSGLQWPGKAWVARAPAVSISSMQERPRLAPCP